jgi:ribose 5-phosphate isomerase B
MKIYFASDHAGFELKNALLAFVRDELALETQDCGAFELDPEDDYPAIIAAGALPVSQDALNGIESCAIVLGGSGTGEAIVANKFRGVRACVFYGGNEDIVRLSREHNHANVLSLGARFLSADAAKSAVRLWLSTPFSQDERHVRRIAQIEQITTEAAHD